MQNQKDKYVFLFQSLECAERQAGCGTFSSTQNTLKKYTHKTLALSVNTATVNTKCIM